MNVHAYNTELKLIPSTLHSFHLILRLLSYALDLNEPCHPTINQTDRIDPSRAPTKSALKFVGFLGISAGFMLAYQRSSCECLSSCSFGVLRDGARGCCLVEER
jgi:hypothetical protein